MGIRLVPSLEFIVQLYESNSIVYIHGNEHCGVLNVANEYKLVKYDIGAYSINVLDGKPIVYFGVDKYHYEKSYQLTAENDLVDFPEFLPRASEGYLSIGFKKFTINLIENDDYDIYWQVTDNNTQEQTTLNYDAYAIEHVGKLYVGGYNEIIAFSDNLTERWSVKCECSYSTGFGRSRFFADNYLIYVSFHEEPSSKKPWPGDTVNVVCLDTGNTLWSTTFDHPVMSVMHHENMIVVGTDVHGFLVDAATGDIRLQFASPYSIMDMESIFLDDGSYEGVQRSESRLWTDGHYLYFTGEGGSQLHIYNMDGSLFSGPHIIPNHYRFDARKQCFHLNGKSYIPVSSAMQAFNLVDFGVMIFDPSSLTPETVIELEVGPERSVEHVIHDKKTESYQLQIYADDTLDNVRDDVIRFAEIETKRIAARFGDQRWTNEEKNRKFNGQIELIVTGSEQMKLACQDMLDILVERVHLWAVESDIDAGNRKGPIKVSWEWRVE